MATLNQPYTVLPSAAYTATSQTGAIPADGNFLNVWVNVSAVSGTTPTLDLSIQWSNDGTNWAAVEPTAYTFTQITAAKQTVKQFVTMARYYRVVYTIGGTSPSFTTLISATTY